MSVLRLERDIYRGSYWVPGEVKPTPPDLETIWRLGNFGDKMKVLENARVISIRKGDTEIALDYFMSGYKYRALKRGKNLFGVLFALRVGQLLVLILLLLVICCLLVSTLHGAASTEVMLCLLVQRICASTVFRVTCASSFLEYS
ncbi:hypothetical protein AVEN_142253-1 [Araneus ventricosus]|uniref:Uncharacterized protein n=1 Tax=Araneus ventricosus TaxID=182803 RepID=A0A4Y2FF04_ARAVE|nr:hypothetical protein AVEN_142253-1 [Araneus ventricosus]